MTVEFVKVTKGGCVAEKGLDNLFGVLFVSKRVCLQLCMVKQGSQPE